MFEGLSPDVSMEDFDFDMFDDSIDILSSEKEIYELTHLSSTIDDLERLNDTISLYGITPSVMHLTNRDRLLSSSMPAFECLESLANASDVTNEQKDAAQEAILSKIAEMVASWFKRAWDFAKYLFDKFGNLFNKIGDRAKKVSIYIKDKTFSAAKALKETVKAHPIASAFVALAATSAIALVTAACLDVPMPVTAAGLAAWKDQINNIINAGLGKFGIHIRDGNLNQEASQAIFAKNISHLQTRGYSEQEARSLLEAASKFAAGNTSAPLRKAAQMAEELLKDVKDDTEGFSSKREAINWLFKLISTLYHSYAAKYGLIVLLVLAVIGRIFAARALKI